VESKKNEWEIRRMCEEREEDSTSRKMKHVPEVNRKVNEE
jgi:hypothetical protein